MQDPVLRIPSSSRREAGSFRRLQDLHCYPTVFLVEKARRPPRQGRNKVTTHHFLSHWRHFDIPGSRYGSHVHGVYLHGPGCCRTLPAVGRRHDDAVSLLLLCGWRSQNDFQSLLGSAIPYNVAEIFWAAPSSPSDLLQRLLPTWSFLQPENTPMDRGVVLFFNLNSQ